MDVSSTSSSFWESSDDGDVSTGSDSDSLHSDTELASVKTVITKGVQVMWRCSRNSLVFDGVVFSSAEDAVSSGTRSRVRGKRYITARRKTGKGKCNGRSYMSSDEDEEDRTGSNEVGHYCRNGSGGGRRDCGGAGAW